MENAFLLMYDVWMTLMNLCVMSNDMKTGFNTSTSN